MATLTLSKNWILGGRSLEFKTSYAIRPGSLSDLIDGCLRKLPPLLYGQDTPAELLDFKGRDPHDNLLPGVVTPHTDELFRLCGVCAVEQAGDDFIWEPFEVVGYSPFKRFEGTHHIVHGVHVERAGALPSWLPTRLLGSAAPIKPRLFRYGLEHFRSIRTFASLGYACQVRESLLIDCVEDSLVVRLTNEYQTREEANPFERIPAYERISSIIEAATGFALQRDLQAELARA